MLNKLLFLVIAMPPIVGFGQRVNYPPAPSSVYAPYAVNSSSQIKSTLWSDDVSTAGNWSFSNVSLTSNNWTIETTSSIVSTSGLIQTTSSSNGFLLFRADTTQGATSEAYAEYAGIPIDLSAYPNVRIQFEQQFISDSNQRMVEVSADGIMWTPFFITDGNSASGARANDLGSIDVSSVIGNASTAFLRFKFSGMHNGYWVVDDIEIRSIDPVDLRAVSMDWGKTGAWGVRMPYYSFIPSQVNDPIEFCAIVANDGLNDLDTAILSVQIPSASFIAQDTFSIQSGVLDTVCTTSIDFSPQNFGDFLVNQSVSTIGLDGNLQNNQFEDFQFRLESDIWAVYSRDNFFEGVQGGINFDVEPGFEHGVGNVFDVFNYEYAFGLEVHIHPSAPIGSELTASIYRYDTLSNEFVLEMQGYASPIGVNNLGQNVIIPFLAGVILEPGSSYLAVASTYSSGASSAIVFATSGISKPNTSFLLDYSAPDLGLQYLTETPMVRLYVNPEGLDEFESRLRMKCYPNPANESTTLSFDLLETSDVLLSLLDLSGKIIETKLLNNQLAGSCKIEWNTNNLENGAYFVRLATNHGGGTQKILIQH